MKSVLAVSVLIAAGVFATAAQAAQRIYSYDPADAQTRKRLDSGLTFVFDRGVMSMRVREVMATEARASALVDPVGEGDLGVRLAAVLPKGAGERDLYEINNEAEGPAMIRAFCPGSTKGWLVFAPLRARQDLVVHALGDDPATGQAKLCATLKFSFRGEWAVPGSGDGRATLRPFQPPSPRF